MTLASLKPLPGTLLLLAIACSDPPPTPAQGAAYLVIQTAGCNVMSSWVVPDGATVTNDAQVGDQVADNSGGAKVSCTVHKKSGGYSITGSVGDGAALFNVQGEVSSGGSLPYEGAGTVAFSDPDIGGLVGTGCALTVNDGQADVIAPGKVWGSFVCDPLKPTSAASSGCRANGSFVFGNCNE